ncbi:MAG: DUF6655 family protein [Planctomycetaceae bacterium]
MQRIGFASLAAAVLLVGIVGCTSSKTSNTARTAKEQMLLSNAIDQSLNKVDFTPMYGQNVFLEDKYLECVDKAYVVGSVRHRVMRAGGRLTTNAEEADVVMELRSGGVGTDTAESFLGTPEIALPGMLTIPEIRLAERKTQFGYSKIGLVIFDAKSRRVLGDGGVAMAQADDNNWFVFGVGPIQNGTLKSDVNRARMTPPGSFRRQIPTTVAFGTRDSVPDASDIQFASEQKPIE